MLSDWPWEADHALSVTLHYLHYNFCCIHETLRITQAMIADVTDDVWSIAGIVAIMRAAEAAPWQSAAV
jgi:hypothetical protein